MERITRATEKLGGLIKIRKLIYNLNPLAKKNQPRGIHMEISIRTVSHNSGNGGCFGLAAKIINADIPSFGSAINYFEIRPHFDDTHNLTPGGEGSFAAYRQSLKDLPSFTFSRVNRNLTMKYKSKVCKGIDLRRSAAERETLTA